MQRLLKELSPLLRNILSKVSLFVIQVLETLLSCLKTSCKGMEVCPKSESNKQQLYLRTVCLILPSCSKPYRQKVNSLQLYISVLPFSVSLSIPEASCYLLSFGRTTVHLHSNVSGFHWKSNLLFSNLKGRYHQQGFSYQSSLLHYVHDSSCVQLLERHLSRTVSTSFKN